MLQCLPNLGDAHVRCVGKPPHIVYGELYIAVNILIGHDDLVVAVNDLPVFVDEFVKQLYYFLPPVLPSFLLICS